MENAAKAVLMAGEVLIGIIILSIMVALFLRMGEISETLNQRAENRDIVMFNTEYQKFQTGDEGADKEYLTPEEVVSLINKVHSWNMSTEDETEEISLTLNEVDVNVNGNDLTINLIEFLKNNKKYDKVLDEKDTIKDKYTQSTLDDFEKFLKDEYGDQLFTCNIEYEGSKGRVSKIIIDNK